MADTSLAQRQAEMRKRMSTGTQRIAKREDSRDQTSTSANSHATVNPTNRSLEELLKCIHRPEGSLRSMISRRDLYDLVWIAPIVSVAKEFGISDVGLAKACRSHHIPLPGRGYWAKVEAGQEPPQPALPETGESWMERLEFQGNFKPANEVAVDKIAEVREELLTGNKIIVPETPSELHPIVAHALQVLGRAKPKPDGFLSPPAGVLDLRVTPKELPRSISIANAFLNALDSRGYIVSVLKTKPERPEPSYWDRFLHWAPSTNTRITILDEQFGFGLSELTEKIPHVLTRDEQRRTDRGDRYGIPQYDHVPSGKLSLWLNMPDLGLRGSWSDGKSQRVEACLNSLVITLIKAAHAIKIARAKEQKEREERAAEEKRRAEHQEWRYEEEKRIKRLDEQLTAWQRADEVRAYAKAVEQAIMKAHGAVDPESELGRWVAWMRDYARRLDPSGREDIGRDRRYW
jgi:hypothetical protein